MGLFPADSARNGYCFLVYSFVMAHLLRYFFNLKPNIPLQTTVPLDQWRLQSVAMKLSDAQMKYLRGLGHPLKPVIIIGDAGLSESVLKEFSSTIDHHELIKVRVRAGERKARDEIISDLCRKQSSAMVNRVGNVALIYRPNKEKPKISLPSG